MKKRVPYVLIFGLYILLALPVAAVQTPQFPGCNAPTGQVIASYTYGTHGVPGDATTYTGSDTVYKINAEMVTQCLCSDQAGGIQTNWWKVSSLTDDNIDVLRRDGWIYVANGAVWGLDHAPYLAKNGVYACGGRGGVIAADTSGQVLGVSTLAQAGNSSDIFFYFAAAGASFVLASAFFIFSKK